MKILRLSLLVVFAGVGLRAQAPVPADAAPVTEGALRTAAELAQLLAPIAAYPDALIALILPATTVPADIVLAARHLRDNGADRSQIEHRAWDDSVKSLTNYPDVLKWMDDNLTWTKQVGEAFALQSSDVMQTIQNLREKARAAGTLVDTPQQQIISEPQVIRIVPAQPDVIYVPTYQPEVVFVDRPVYYSAPLFTFGVGAIAGSWLAYDCDWRHRTIWVGNRHRPWTVHDWRRPVVSFSTTFNHNRAPTVRAWRPPSTYFRRPATSTHYVRTNVARPAPFGRSSYSNSYSGSPRPAVASNHDSRRGPAQPPQLARSFPTPRNYQPATVAPPTASVVPPTSAAAPSVGWSRRPNATTSSSRPVPTNPSPAQITTTAPTQSRMHPTTTRSPISNRDSRDSGATSNSYSRPNVTRSAPAATPTMPATPAISTPAPQSAPRSSHRSSSVPSTSQRSDSQQSTGQRSYSHPSGGQRSYSHSSGDQRSNSHQSTGQRSYSSPSTTRTAPSSPVVAPQTSSAPAGPVVENKTPPRRSETNRSDDNSNSNQSGGNRRNWNQR